MFSPSDISKMRATQVTSLLDLCIIERYTRTINEFGEPISDYVDDGIDAYGDCLDGGDAIETECGFEPKAGREQEGQDYTKVEHDGIIRLPIETLITAQDRVRIVQRHGEDIIPVTYEIVSPIQRGISGIRLVVKATKV